MGSYPGFTNGDLERHLWDVKRRLIHELWMGRDEEDDRVVKLRAELRRAEREADKRGMP